MAYLNDVMNSIKCKYDEVTGSNIRLLIGKGAIVEGFTKLISCSSEEIIIKFSRDIITICGENLKIASVNCKELTVIGKITCIAEKV